MSNAKINEMDLFSLFQREDINLLFENTELNIIIR